MAGPTQVTQRWVASDKRKELYQASNARQVLTLPNSEKHVFFSAAQDFQSELDGPSGPNNLRLGLLTAALVSVLANSTVNDNSQQAIVSVNNAIESLKASTEGMPVPEPDMEAPVEKQEIPMFAFSDEQLGPEPSAATHIPLGGLHANH